MRTLIKDLVLAREAVGCFGRLVGAVITATWPTHAEGVVAGAVDVRENVGPLRSSVTEPACYIYTRPHSLRNSCESCENLRVLAE